MDAITRAQKHIDTLDPAVSGSGGHAATYRACRILVNDYNLSVEEAWPILLTYNEKCDPPWHEKDLRRKLEALDEEQSFIRAVYGVGYRWEADACRIV